MIFKSQGILTFERKKLKYLSLCKMYIFMIHPSFTVILIYFLQMIPNGSFYWILLGWCERKKKQ